MANLKRPSPQRFPDLYALLALRPLESDPASIEAALRRLAAHVKSAQLADEDQASAAREAKIVELGKHHLLSPVRKQRYDQQWRQLHARHSEEITSAHDEIDPKFAELLPSGDPAETFRLAEYMHSAAGQSRSAYEADFVKLQELLCPADEKHVNSIVELSRPSLEDRALEPSGQLNVAAKAWTPAQGAEAGAPAFNSPSRQRRKQRERRLRWSAIGGLASLAVILSLSYWFKPGEAIDAERSATAEAQGHLNSPTVRPLPPESTPRRSGLPSVSGIAPDQDLTNNLDDLVPVAPADVTPAGRVPVEVVPVEVVAALGSDNMQPGPTTVLTSPEMLGPMQAGDMPGPPPDASQPSLDDAQRAAWETSMQSAKRLIGQQQYADANQQLAANEELAKTELQQSQLRRLSQISSLAEELQQALRAAIKGLSAGEVVMIGSSTPVGIVDSAEDRITIRMRGENRKFLLTELPIGLAFALSDLTLDVEAPSSLARKAAFAWVHPGAAGSDVAAQRAQEMLAAAAAGGAIDPDLLQVFTDDYQLPATSD